MLYNIILILYLVDKKAEKLSINWNQKLVSIKEKNHEALKKLSNFYTKVIYYCLVISLSLFVNIFLILIRFLMIFKK